MTAPSRWICERRCRCGTQKIALADVKAEVELGFDRLVGLRGARRCLNCDVQTVFSTPLCIECDACVDICHMDCITFSETARSQNSPPGRQRRLEILRRPLHLQSLEDRPDHGEG
jgi:ferredoxin